jgi:hypothetical protein
LIPERKEMPDAFSEAFESGLIFLGADTAAPVDRRTDVDSDLNEG